mmetsp:Transcript_22098/g.57586  ORF Transcript_22098/g.57586 Transcript_22098/m.57586 type:complete len:367 (+) Transcript_22098:824-1924(+)
MGARLNDGAVGDNGVLAHHNDAILDDVALLLLVGLHHVVLVHNLAVGADAGILVDDRLLHDRVGADAHGQAARHQLALLQGLVVVRAHDHGVLHDGVLRDQCTHAHNGVGDLCVGAHDAAVADDAVGHVRVQHLGGRQEARHGVDGRLALVEAEFGGVGVGEGQVGAVKGLDGSDVLPVPVKQERLHLGALVLGKRDDLRAKVVRVRVVVQQLAQQRALHHVDAHRGQVRHLRRPLRVEAEHGGVDAHGLERVAGGLLRKLDDAAGVVDLHEAKRLRLLLGAGQRGDSDGGLRGAVRGHKLLVVHAVQVVARQDEEVLHAVGHRLLKQPHVLAHRVGRTLEPVGVLRALLRGQHLHKALVHVASDV